VSEDSKRREEQVASVIDLFEGLLSSTVQAAPDLSVDDRAALFMVVLAVKLRGEGVPKAGWIMAAATAYDSAGQLILACEQAERRRVAQA